MVARVRISELAQFALDDDGLAVAHRDQQDRRLNHGNDYHVEHVLRDLLPLRGEAEAPALCSQGNQRLELLLAK